MNPLINRFLVVLSLLTLLGTGALATELVQLVPADWPVIVRIDSSADTASGAFLKNHGQTPDIQEMNKAMETGLAQLLSAVGLDIDVQEGILPWAGEKAVFAVNPLTRPVPGLLLAVSSKDRGMAEERLRALLGSLIRDVDPSTSEVTGATIYVWPVKQADVRPAYAVGDDFVLFAADTATLKAGLEGVAAEGGPGVAALLEPHKDDLIAFAVDATRIAAQEAGNGEDSKQNPEMTLLAQISAHGGIGINEQGLVLTVAGDLPPILKAMLGQMVPAAGQVSSASVGLPSNTLAALMLSGGALLAPLQEPMSDLAETRPDVGAAALLSISAGTAPVAIGLTGLIPQPSFVAAISAESAQAADQIMSEFRKLAGGRGIKLVPEPRSAPQLIHRLMTGDETAKGAGFLGQNGASLFFGSDWRSVQRAAAITSTNSLSSKSVFAETMDLVGGPSTVTAWLSLDAISALGYLYQGMGSDFYPPSKWLADALKSTRGLGLSAGLNPSGAEIKLGMRTDVGPGTGMMAGYAGIASAYASAILLFLGRTHHSEEAAKGAVSLSNLRQLGLALEMYAADWDNRLPPAKEWRKSLEPYLHDKGLLESPWTDEGIEYAYNPKLSGLDKSKVTNPVDVLAFYTSSAGAPAAPGSASREPDMQYRAVYLDGHAVATMEKPPASAFTPRLLPSPKAAPKPTPKAPAKKQ